MALNYTQEQRSIAWYRDRLGYITGSRVGCLMKTGKSDAFSTTAKSYLHQVSAERALSRDIVDDDEMLKYYVEQTTSQSKAMRFGTEQEENARALYTDISDCAVKEVGLCKHPTIPYLASSPDGIVIEGKTMGCLEIKCPAPATFSLYVTEIHDNASLLRVNPEYYYQCQSHMACTCGTFCDFVVFCPFEQIPIHIVRIERDNEAIAQIEERVKLAETFIRTFHNNLQTA